jgi:hypothetical protein
MRIFLCGGKGNKHKLCKMEQTSEMCFIVVSYLLIRWMIYQPKDTYFAKSLLAFYKTTLLILFLLNRQTNTM